MSSSVHLPHVSDHQLRAFDQPARRPSFLAPPAIEEESSTANRVQSETRHPQSSDNRVQSETRHPQFSDNRVQSETRHPQSSDNRVQSETRHPQSSDNRVQSETRHRQSSDNRVQSQTRHCQSSDMLTEEEKQNAKLRRSSFPPVPRSRHPSGAKVTSSKSRQSLSEVVARMRFREKTLLGEAFFKAPRKKSDSVPGSRRSVNGDALFKARKTSDTVLVSHRSSGNGETLFKARKSSDTVLVSHRPSGNGEALFKGRKGSDTVIVSHPPTNGFIRQKHGGEGVARQTHRVPPFSLTETPGAVAAHSPRSIRTRKNGTVLPLQAWETPRESAQASLEIRGAPVLSRSVPCKDSSAAVTGQGINVPDIREPQHRQGGSEDVLMGESGQGETAVDGADNGGDGGDDDDSDMEFNFDEGEDEVEAQRQAQRYCLTTSAVYQRACHRLGVRPAPAFLRQVNVTAVDLHDAGLGPSDVKPIAIALVRDTNVCFLDLSNNDLGPVGVSYIAEMLQENTTLFDLNLSGTNPGREGVKALSETLPHNRCLLFLRLEENGIEHTEAHLLADIIQSVPKLQGLYLGHNRLGYRGGAAIASAMAQNKSLLTLDLHWNHIRRDSAVALVRSLAKNSNLRQLNLAWNGLGKEGCLALAHVLPENTSLMELDLTCNRLDLLSLGFLLKGLARNTRLTSLKIGQNPITTEGAKALLETIRTCPDMAITEIDITGVPVDVEFSQMLSEVQKTRLLYVKHEEALTLATSNRTREHDGTNLDRYDPVMVLFEYIKLDNLRVIDMFQYMDVKKRDKLSKANIRDGLNTMRVPVTEHAIDVIVQKLDLNKDGFVELDEMMKVQRDTARQVKLRQIKAKAKNREDESLKGLHQILREVISKRTEENESRRDSQIVSSTKTSGGRRKSSVGGLQLTQARYSVTSLNKRQHGEQLQTIPDQ